MASILVIDADPVIRNEVAHALQEHGYDVTQGESAGVALRKVRRQQPDLVICDFALPDLPVVDLLDDMRDNSSLKETRVVITSSCSEPNDIVLAFEHGADDFIEKPINPLELHARVDACLRRPANAVVDEQIESGGIVIDNAGWRVSVNGEFLSLARREFRLLQFLITNQDRVFSRQQLLSQVWGRATAVGPRTVDVHIRRLRSALEASGYDRYVQTVRGSGYRFSLAG